MPETVPVSTVIATARACVGTPFHHLGRQPGLGLDCVGLLVHTARTVGATHHDLDRYARFSTDDTLVRELDKCLIPWHAELRPGLAVVFRVDRRQMHAGILADHPTENILTVIHAYNRRSGGFVCEHVLDDDWKQRIIRAYVFPGVAY